MHALMSPKSQAAWKARDGGREVLGSTSVHARLRTSQRMRRRAVTHRSTGRSISYRSTARTCVYPSC